MRSFPVRLRLVAALARGLRGLLALGAPAAIRGRWREEWAAEIEHAAERLAGQPRAALRLLVFSAGMVPDGLRLRRLPDRPAERRRRAWMGHALGQDLLHAARGIAVAPAFAITVVGSLSLGIAANAVAFAIISAVLFPTIPGVADQKRLVAISLERNCGWPGCSIGSSTFDDYRLLADGLPSLAGLSASAPMPLAVGVRGQALSLAGALVSTNYFDVLGVALSHGRSFTPEEGRPSAEGVAVIGHGLWQQLFGGDRAVLGTFVTVGGHQVRIVGVASEAFAGEGLRWTSGRQIWLPSGMADRVGIPAGRSSGIRMPGNEFDIAYVGRLSAASSIERVHAEAQVAAARVAAARPDGRHGAFATVKRHGVRETSGILPEILAIMLVPLTVLAIACVNAGNVLVARGTQRVRDTAVRLALGASRWRVVRLMLVECALLALLSAVVTLPLLAWAFGALSAVVPATLAVDRWVVLFSLLAAIASVAIFGLAPAIRLSAADPSRSLGSSRTGDSPGRSRLRRLLVAVQVALSLGLLATGSQLISAVRQLSGVTGAKDPAGLLLVSYDLQQFKTAPAAADDFYARLLGEVQRLPGVEHAGLARPTALWTFGRGKGPSAVVVWLPEALSKDAQMLLGGFAGGDLFDAVGLRVVSGRGFEPGDRIGTPRVAVVTRAAADEYFKGHAVGRVIRVAARDEGYGASREVQIVGVIDSTLDPNYTRRSGDAAQRAIYLPGRLEPEPVLALYVRGRVAPATLVPAIRTATDAVDPRVPFSSTGTLWDRLYEREIESRLAAQAIAALGVLALALACGGLYGVVSFLVSMRRREIGVRIALGAEPRGIVRLVLRQGMTMAAAGGMLGAAIAAVLSAVIRASMHNIPTLDVTAFVLTTGVLIGAMLLASFLPARRAARLDPMVVLHDE